ncbi:MAG: hypothetical protein ACTS4X_00645 [Candidatus Hodgkinia cicadicola]
MRDFRGSRSVKPRREQWIGLKIWKHVLGGVDVNGRRRVLTQSSEPDRPKGQPTLRRRWKVLQNPS